MGNEITEKPQTGTTKKQLLAARQELNNAVAAYQTSIRNFQFDHALYQLTAANIVADDMLRTNRQSLGAISASGERIDRLNRDNEHSLAKLVTGSAA